jgi:hypothetical protein
MIDSKEDAEPPVVELTMDEKRSLVTARLKEREAARQAQNASRRENQDMGFMQAKVREFASEFESGKREVTRKSSAVQEAHRVGGAAASRAALAECTAAIERLQALVSDGSHFLPSYDVRKAQSAVDELRKAIGAAREAVAPRKAFSFASRRKEKRTAAKAAKAAAAAAAADVAPAAEASAAASASAAPSTFRAGDVVTDVAAESTLDLSTAQRAHIVSNRIGETICIGAAELAGGEGAAPEERKALRLSQLRDCTIFIQGVAGSLRAEKLVGCRIYAGPVTGSCLMFEVEQCVVAIAARQFRLHRCVGTDFYVRSRSGPIIEHCSALRFAPYHVRYAGLDAELSLPLVGLPALATAEAVAQEEASGAWSDVKDFNWHRAQHSPNWCVLPLDEREATPTAPAPDREGGAAAGGGGEVDAPPLPPATDDADAESSEEL